MAPSRKVPPGSTTRSVLLRGDQIAALDATADLFGVDLSDVVRGAVDLLFPADRAEEEARVRAALEIRRREIDARPAAVRAELVRAVLDGWRGQEPRLSLGAAGRAAAKLVADTVGMVRRLYPDVPRGSRGLGDVEGRWTALNDDWAGRSPAGLLSVVACPAARCLVYRPAPPRPDVVILAPAVGGGPDATAAERQYEAAGRALVELLADGRLVETSPHKFPSGSAFFPGRAFWIDWEKLGRS